MFSVGQVHLGLGDARLGADDLDRREGSDLTCFLLSS